MPHATDYDSFKRKLESGKPVQIQGVTLRLARRGGRDKLYAHADQPPQAAPDNSAAQPGSPIVTLRS